MAKKRMDEETKLRQELYNEIMANTTPEDDCPECNAYRHAAKIVLGEAQAEPPIMKLTEVEDFN